MSRKVTNKAMGGTVYMGLILLHINKLDTNQKREKKKPARSSGECRGAGSTWARSFRGSCGRTPWASAQRPTTEAEPTGSLTYGARGQNWAVKGMKIGAGRGGGGDLTQGGAKSMKLLQSRT